VNAVRRVDDGVVVRLLLAQPAHRNAITPAMADDLARHVAALEAHPPGLVVVAGEGGFFSAGGDLLALDDLPAERVAAFMRQMTHTLDRLSALPAPVVAYVEGRAVGGGWEIALAADLVFVHPEAAIHLSQVRLGLCPGWGGGRRLARRVGSARALGLLLEERRLDAASAVQAGVADGILTPEAFAAWVASAAAHEATLLTALKRSLHADAAPLFDRLWQGPRRRAASAALRRGD
jgi:enoyl-CoA hydratase/carnithine racemase